LRRPSSSFVAGAAVAVLLACTKAPEPTAVPPSVVDPARATPSAPAPDTGDDRGVAQWFVERVGASCPGMDKPSLVAAYKAYRASGNDPAAEAELRLELTRADAACAAPALPANADTDVAAPTEAELDAKFQRLLDGDCTIADLPALLAAERAYDRANPASARAWGGALDAAIAQCAGAGARLGDELTTLQLGARPIMEAVVDGQSQGAKIFYGPNALRLKTGAHDIVLIDKSTGNRVRLRVTLGADERNKLVVDATAKPPVVKTEGAVAYELRGTSAAAAAGSGSEKGRALQQRATELIFLCDRTERAALMSAYVAYRRDPADAKLERALKGALEKADAACRKADRATP
jgi:hypothetical protein